MELSTPFFRSGRNITCDDYVTDLVLSFWWMGWHSGYRQMFVSGLWNFLPHASKAKKKFATYESEFAFHGGTIFVRYQSERSNKAQSHSAPCTVTLLWTTLRQRKKNQTIKTYNSTKGAVDNDRQAVACLLSEKQDRLIVMFANVIDLAMTAARCIVDYHVPRAGSTLRQRQEVCLHRKCSWTADVVTNQAASSAFQPQIKSVSLWILQTSMLCGSISRPATLKRRFTPVNLPKSLHHTAEQTIRDITGKIRGHKMACRGQIRQSENRAWPPEPTTYHTSSSCQQCQWTAKAKTMHYLQQEARQESMWTVPQIQCLHLFSTSEGVPGW